MEVIRRVLKSFNIIFKSIGFDNLGDFLNSIFFKGKITILIYAGSLSAFILLVNTFIGKYIYHPAEAIWLLTIVSLVDMITGVTKTIQKGGTPDSYRMTRAVVRLVMQIFIIFMIFRMHGIFPSYIYRWMVDAVVLAFLIATLWSVTKNSYELGWIQKDSYKLIESILNADKLFKKIFGKDEKDNGSGNTKDS